MSCYRLSWLLTAQTAGKSNWRNDGRVVGPISLMSCLINAISIRNLMENLIVNYRWWPWELEKCDLLRELYYNHRRNNSSVKKVTKEARDRYNGQMLPSERYRVLRIMNSNAPFGVQSYILAPCSAAVFNTRFSLDFNSRLHGGLTGRDGLEI